MIVAKYTGCGNQPNGTSRFCFSDCAACTSPGPPVIDAALRRPRDREHVEHVAGLARRGSPAPRGTARSRPTPSRRPTATSTCRAMVPKCSWNAATSKSANAPDHVRPSMSAGSRPGVGDRPLGGLGADLARGAARRLRVRGLADAGDRDLAAHVVELGRVTPVAVTGAHAAEPALVSTTRAGYRRPRTTVPRAQELPMAMPTDIGVIDLMIGIPVRDRRHHYEFLRASLRDRESLEEFEFPAQYMFKDVPQLEAATTRSRSCSSRWTSSASRRACSACPPRGSPRAKTRRGAEGPPRPLLREHRGRPEPRHGRGPRPARARSRSSA